MTSHPGPDGTTVTFALSALYIECILLLSVIGQIQKSDKVYLDLGKSACNSYWAFHNLLDLYQSFQLDYVSKILAVEGQGTGWGKGMLVVDYILF